MVSRRCAPEGDIGLQGDQRGLGWHLELGECVRPCLDADGGCYTRRLKTRTWSKAGGEP